MCCRLVCVPLLFVVASFVSACGNSTASNRRDGAVPGNDSSPGQDAQSDVAVPDGPSPDGVVGADTATKETTAWDLGRDTTLTDAPEGADTTAKETAGAELHRDTALTDTRGPETVEAAIDAARAEGDASEGRGDGAGTAADGSLAAFCTGTATRSMLNGYPGAPVVRVSRIVTGCCDGFTLELNSATYASPIFVTAIVSGASLVPVDIALDNPSQDWRFSVSSDCETTSLSSCKERYDSGFVGTFRTARVEDSTAIDLGLCLHVEDVDGSHRLLQTLDLYIPHAIAK